MMRFLLCCLVTVTLFSNNAIVETMINDPSTVVDGKVNAVTGYPCVYEEDVVIQGAEPIRLSRVYIHGQVDGYWKIPGELCRIAVTKEADYRWVIEEPDECPIVYKQHGRPFFDGRDEYIRYVPSNLNTGFSNTSRGEVSSRTNLRNHYVLFDAKKVKDEKKPKCVTIHRANGAVRYYKRVSKTDDAFRLIEEHLPNGNWILYEYDSEKYEDGKLPKPLSIRTTNASRTKEYARATFRYKDSKNKEFQIIGSDGQTVEYALAGGGKYRNLAQSRLKTIKSSSRFDQTLHYTQFKDIFKNTDDRLELISSPLKRRFCLGYYSQDKEKVAGRTLEMQDTEIKKRDADGKVYDYRKYPDPRRGRIKTIASPVGVDAWLHTTHSFIYEKGYTSVYDFEGKKTDVFVDLNARLKKIEYFSKEGTLQKIDAYAWSSGEETGGRLLAKSLLNENRDVISSITYTYDEIGNILEKKLCGDLTGAGILPEITKQFNTPEDNGAEVATTKYTYSHGILSLLEKEEPPSGLVKTYTYLEGTDLITSELSDQGEIKTRRFWEYIDGILTREITDDGSSSNSNDFSNITYRNIREIVPRSEGPYLGLPEVILEKYWENGQEHLLSKRILRYGNAAKITEEEIYGADGQHCYTIYRKYDEKHRLASETDALGRVAYYGYDPLGNQIYLADFSGRVETRAEYDFSNRPRELVKTGDDGIILSTKFSYNGLHQLCKKTNPQGYDVQHQYDPLGRCSKTILPSMPSEDGEFCSPVVQKKYDAAGNEIESIDAMGNVTKTTYNAYQAPVCITYPDGMTDLYSYNLDGNLKSHSDPAGIVTAYVNDYLGRVVEKAVISPAGELLTRETFEYKGKLLRSKTDAMGNITRYTYDGAGRKVAEECVGEKIQFSYDALGRLHKIQKEEIIFIAEHDLLDRVIEERTEDISGKIVRKIGYAYDSAGNRETITHYIAGGEHQEVLRYDSQNRLIERIDPLGNSEKVEFDDFFVDEHGQKVLQKTHTDDLGLETIETHNSHQLVAKQEKRKGKVLKQEEKFYNHNGLACLHKETVFHSGKAVREIKTRWQYDCRDRLQALIESEDSSNPKITRYGYTPKGLVHTITKPNGVVLTHGYNDLGFHTSLNSSDESVNHNMEYNLLGHLISLDGISRECDFAGRLLSEIFPTNMKVGNQYDLSGRRIENRIPQLNCLIGYAYNGLDLMTVQKRNSNGELLYQHEYSDWDLSGHLLKESLVGDIGTISYTTDPLSRKKQIQSPYFEQEVLEFDPVGNIRKMQVQGDFISYGYDDLYQLIFELGPFAHSYQFDSLSNRLQKDDEIYEVNDRNEVISHMEYDENGNPQKFGEMLFTYDALGRLIKIETPLFTENYTYDALHRRLSRTKIVSETEQTRYFLYDGQNEIGLYDQNREMQEFRVLGYAPHAEIGATIAIEIKGNIYAPIHDLQGNIAVLIPIDPEQTPSSYRYSAFGEEKVEGEILSPWRFSSKRADETGFVYYGRRYYSPGLGRWLTPDPAGLTDGMNLYAFVHNNPLIHFDEYGLLEDEYGVFGILAARREESQNYLNGGYQFEDYYHHYTPPSYVPGEFSNKPPGEIALFTGIRTNSQEHQDMLKYTSELAGGVPVHGVHMPTHGFLQDLLKCSSTLGTGTNSTVDHGERYIREALGRVGPDGRVMILAHSAGAMNAYFALQRFPQEMKDQVTLRTIAPAKIVSRRDVDDVQSFKSSGFDGLMSYHSIFHAREYRQALNSGLLQEISKHPSAKRQDHSYMSPTFERTIEDVVETFRGEYGPR